MYINNKALGTVSIGRFGTDYDVTTLGCIMLLELIIYTIDWEIQ